MIIRTTQKILRIAGLKLEKNAPTEIIEMPGEWTVGLVSLGKPGKFAINYVHNFTRISILLSGKSLSKANMLIQNKIIDFLNRHHYSDLIKLFQLDSQISIYPSANRSVLGYMNGLRQNFEYQFEKFLDFDTLDFTKIEDIYLDYPFTIKTRGSKMFTPKEILESLK